MRRHPDKTELIVADPIAVELAWDNGVLVSTRIMWSDKRIPTGHTAAGKKLQQALTRLMAGQAPNWPRVPIAFRELPDFTRTVLQTLYNDIPYGETTTYGELAEKAGSPKAAPAVGQIMANNPWPLIVPCHRVVSCTGDIGSYTGDIGVDMKEFLLKAEGALS